MFPELKHYSCDKEVSIKQTVIGRLEMVAQKFEDYYCEDLTPNDKNDWILDPFSGKDLPHLPLHVTEEFMDMTTEATNRISFASEQSATATNRISFAFERTIPKRFCKYPLLGFHEFSISNSLEICDKKIDSVRDNLDLRNCI